MSASVLVRSGRRLFPLLAMIAAASCTRSDVLTTPPTDGAGTTLPALQVKPIDPPELSSLKASAPAIVSCAPATVYPLTDGTHSAGTVSVSNDATRLYVTYATPGAYWWLANTQLAVAKTAAAIPRDDAGAPSPWDFSRGKEHEPPIKSVTYSVALSTLGVQAGQVAYVSAMAGVEHPVVESEAGLEGSWEWLVAWGVGGTPSTSTEVVHAYTVASCSGTTTPPPPPPPPVDTSSHQTPAGQGAISITFDDGFATTYNNVYPVLRDLGIKGNAAVNPTPIDEGWGGYMKPAQVQELWDNGWAVVSHTMDHADLTTLAAPAMEAEIRDAKAWIISKGYGPSSVFIVPFHSWGPRERTMIAKYHTYVRGHTIDEFDPEKFATWPVTEPMDINAFEPEFAPYRTEAGRAKTLAKVKYAVDNGLYLDLMFHRVPTATLPQFRELMTSIATTYRANIVTWKDVAR